MSGILPTDRISIEKAIPEGWLLVICIWFGRGEGIRTPDPLAPSQVRYQAALRPDETFLIISNRMGIVNDGMMVQGMRIVLY